MAFGAHGRAMTWENLLSYPRRFGLERDQAEEVQERIGEVVAQHWRDTLSNLGAQRREIEHLVPWYGFAEQLLRQSTRGSKTTQGQAGQ